MLHFPVKAVLFDFYQTLVEIKTDEKKDQLWQVLAAFLEYRVRGRPGRAEAYQQQVEESLKSTRERYPEIDVRKIFRRLLDLFGVGSSQALVRTVAQLFRVLSIERFQLYPETSRGSPATAPDVSAGPGLGQPARLSRCRAGQNEPPPLLRHRRQLICSGISQARPAHLREALSRLRVARNEVVYVGDFWDRDMKGAGNAGIQGIWLRRGGDSSNVPDPCPVPIITDLRELAPLLGHVSGRL